MMNAFLIEKITEAITKNIENNTAADFAYDESADKYYLPEESILNHVATMTAEICESVIEKFNKSSLAQNNKIVLEKFEGKLIACFKWN